MASLPAGAADLSITRKTGRKDALLEAVRKAEAALRDGPSTRPEVRCSLGKVCSQKALVLVICAIRAVRLVFTASGNPASWISAGCFLGLGLGFSEQDCAQPTLHASHDQQ
jgi:hypothetical protein